MRFEIDIDVPRRSFYLLSHSAKRLIIESLAPGADVIHRCFADGCISVFGDLSLTRRLTLLLS